MAQTKDKPGVKLVLISFENLRDGDRILCSFGTVTVKNVNIEGWRARVETHEQGVISWHRDNWPFKVVASS